MPSTHAYFCSTQFPAIFYKIKCVHEQKEFYLFCQAWVIYGFLLSLSILNFLQ